MAQENHGKAGGQRLKLIVAYDGGCFSGLQSQAHGRTVQDCLERAFHQLGAGGNRLHAASRTDAGVHAEAQCVHMDVPLSGREAWRWREALNAHLPEALRVLSVVKVSTQFHARFSARRKRYRYEICRDRVVTPFLAGRVWQVTGQLDLEKLHAGAALLKGRHDFRAFGADRGKEMERTVRDLKLEVHANRRRIWLRFEADGFLYKMVRLLTGTLVMTARGRVGLEDLRRMATGQGSTARYCAPPEGLYLEKIFYRG